MEFWSPLILLFAATALVVALGIHIAIAAPLGFVSTLIWAAHSLGGTKDGTSFLMVVVYLLLPISFGNIMAAGIGLGVRAIFGGKSLAQVALKGLTAAPVAATCEQAADTAAEHFRVGGRVRIRCPRCQRTLNAKRILSVSQSEPDIEVNCNCGSCLHVYPFRKGTV